MKKKILCLSFSAILLTLVAGCYVPSPLYGKWQSGSGDTITFIQGGEYIAKIGDTQYDGSWVVNDNVIVISKSDGSSFVSEWNIRGSILRLNW